MTINQSLAVPVSGRGNQFRGSVKWERDEEVPSKGVNRKTVRTVTTGAAKSSWPYYQHVSGTSQAATHPPQH